MKILITGSSGILGSEACRYFARHEVFAPDRTKLDLTRLESVQSLARMIVPDVVIHAAAHTDLEKCQIDPKAAFQINTLGTELLLQSVCRSEKTLFIYISSSGVYGSSRPSGDYTEFDSPSPTTVHHQTKLLAEQAVRNWTRNHLILRTGWLFGGAPGLRKNFVYNRFKEASGKSVLYSDPTQRGNPTSITTFLRQMDRLISANVCGTFNAVNLGSASRLQYVTEIIRGFGLPCRVEEGRPDQFVRVAPVSKDESAINQSLDLLGLNVFADWKDDLLAYIFELKRLI